jgi:D-alanyl-D-alanine carboxypeptidase
MFYDIRLRLVGCFVVALCTACGGGGGNTTAGGDSWDGCPALTPSTQPAGSLGAIVDAAVATEMASQKMPGISVAIAKNGTILYAQGYGYSDLSTCAPMPANAQMQIGSLTKQFTAVAVLQLQQAGLLDIDHTVLSYLPNYAFDPRITLRMLLNQTSGIQDYLDLPIAQQYAGGVVPESRVLKAIVQAQPLFPPDTAFSYSNSNYFILGSIIEAVTGQSYPDYLTANVFHAAGLSNTFYTRPSPSASPYKPGASGPVAGGIPDPSAYFAAGALWSNVQDLATWDAAQWGGIVIPQSLFKLMLTPASVPRFQQSVPSTYGMGWIQGGTLAGHPFVWHNGGTVSYASFSGLLPDDGFSVTVLTNYSVQEDTPLLNLGEKLIQGICTGAATAGSC